MSRLREHAHIIAAGMLGAFLFWVLVQGVRMRDEAERSHVERLLTECVARHPAPHVAIPGENFFAQFDTPVERTPEVALRHHGLPEAEFDMVERLCK